MFNEKCWNTKDYILVNLVTFNMLISLYQQSQLGNAVFKEEYDDAARLKVAIAAAATNDAVGRVMSNLNVRKEIVRLIDFSIYLFMFSKRRKREVISFA